MAVISHNCPTCSATLTFDIDTQDWTCDYCKRSFTIDELKEYVNRKKEYHNGYNCENCGAEIVSYEEQLSTTCAYCGSPTIIRGKIKGDYKPDFIVPFKHTKEDVINAFLKNRRQLSPSKFFSAKNIKSISGVYIPYWLFSCSAETSIKGECHDSKTRKIFMRRRATMEIDRIPADAKTKLNNEYLGGLEPFEYEKMKKFEYPYLAGFNAELFDDSIDDTFEEQIKMRIFEATIQKMRLEDGFYYNLNDMDKETLLMNRRVEHVLMPVWCMHISFNNEEYIYYINDQNLVIAGKYPVSFLKEIILWGLILTLTGMTAFLALNHLIFEILFILVGVVIFAWGAMIRTVDSYHRVKRNTTNTHYIKPKSFHFTEYKDEYLDDPNEFDKPMH